LCAVGRESSPARPGARDVKAGMAFSVCVRHVAPASRPRSPSSYVAVEWPMDTLMPCVVKTLINEDESGSSGARVTSFTVFWRLDVP
jgi:hypothetical protein